MIYKDKTRTVADRVQDLLQRMTLGEKAGQLVQPFGWQCYEKHADGTTGMTEAFKRQVATGGVGSLYGTLRADPWTGVTLETGLSPKEGRRPLMPFRLMR